MAFFILEDWQSGTAILVSNRPLVQSYGKLKRGLQSPFFTNPQRHQGTKFKLISGLPEKKFEPRLVCLLFLAGVSLLVLAFLSRFRSGGERRP